MQEKGENPREHGMLTLPTYAFGVIWNPKRLPLLEEGTNL